MRPLASPVSALLVLALLVAGSVPCPGDALATAVWRSPVAATAGHAHGDGHGHGHEHGSRGAGRVSGHSDHSDHSDHSGHAAPSEADPRAPRIAAPCTCGCGGDAPAQRGSGARLPDFVVPDELAPEPVVGSHRQPRLEPGWVPAPYSPRDPIPI